MNVQMYTMSKIGGGGASLFILCNYDVTILIFLIFGCLLLYLLVFMSSCLKPAACGILSCPDFAHNPVA